MTHQNEKLSYGSRREIAEALSASAISHSMPSIAHCVMTAALNKLDDCRVKCPGAGGDVDAMNLRYMIEHRAESSALLQAASRLESLSDALGIDAIHEVEALRSIAEQI